MLPSEPWEAPAGRRSRAEMVCDLMLAISKGAVHPTRIMQRANLTWNALLVYLHILVANGFVRREEQDGRAAYRLTEKGVAAIRDYTSLREDLGPLNLEELDTRSFVKSLRVPLGSKAEDIEREKLEAVLREGGYKMVSNKAKGRSGVEHEFAVIATDPLGVTHGYVFAKRPDENLILGLFVKQLDTGFKMHVLQKEEGTRRAKELAREYGISTAPSAGFRLPSGRRRPAAG